jgi:hypothetical protein
VHKVHKLIPAQKEVIRCILSRKWTFRVIPRERCIAIRRLTDEQKSVF